MTCLDGSPDAVYVWFTIGDSMPNEFMMSKPYFLGFGGQGYDFRESFLKMAGARATGLFSDLVHFVLQRSTSPGFPEPVRKLFPSGIDLIKEMRSLCLFDTLQSLLPWTFHDLSRQFTGMVGHSQGLLAALAASAANDSADFRLHSECVLELALWIGALYESHTHLWRSIATTETPMLAVVKMSVPTLQKFVDHNNHKLGHSCSISVINSSSASVVSGIPSELRELNALLQLLPEAPHTKFLPVGAPHHTSILDPVDEALQKCGHNLDWKQLLSHTGTSVLSCADGTCLSDCGDLGKLVRVLTTLPVVLPEVVSAINVSLPSEHVVLLDCGPGLGKGVGFLLSHNLQCETWISEQWVLGSLDSTEPCTFPCWTDIMTAHPGTMLANQCGVKWRSPARSPRLDSHCAADVEHFTVIKQALRELGIEEHLISTSLKFADVGISSVQAVQFATMLAGTLHLRLDFGLVMKYPTVAALLSFLRGAGTEAPEKSGAAENSGSPVAFLGLTAPSPLSQVEVFQTALQSASVDPALVSFVEMHGTGTPLGDPIEMESFMSVYCENRSEAFPLLIGASKTNIGHAEAAAGLAGLLKAVLCLQHSSLPPVVHFTHLNPKIQALGLVSRIHIPTKSVPLPQLVPSLYAAVSSFGFSGTNAHCIVQQAPLPSQPAKAPQTLSPPTGETKSPHCYSACPTLVVTAANEQSLTISAAEQACLFRSCPLDEYQDACGTLFHHRMRFKHRLAIMDPSPDSAAQKLASWAAGELQSDFVVGCPLDNPTLALVFSGQGSKLISVGKQLFVNSPVYAEAFLDCSHLFNNLLQCNLVDAMGYITSDFLPELPPVLVQPALFSVSYALASVILSWGIQPQYLLGHSFGEYVAAAVSGAIPLPEAAKLVACRAILMSRLESGWTMVAVQAQIPDIDGVELDRVHVCCNNGLAGLVLGGKRPCLETVVHDIESLGVKCTWLPVEHAFHSPHVDGILEDLRNAALECTTGNSTIPIVSSVTGKLLPDKAMDADYWCQHARQTVRFDLAINTLMDLGVNVVVEPSASPTIIGILRQNLKNDAASMRMIPTLHSKVSFASPVVLKSGLEVGTETVEVEIQGLLDEETGFRLHSATDRSEEIWTPHVTGTICSTAEDTLHPLDLQLIRRRCELIVDVEDFYCTMKAAGVEYAKAFRGLQDLFSGDGEVLARVV
eukprot:gene10720-1949_t